MKYLSSTAHQDTSHNQHGIAHIILLSVAALGIIAFVLISSNLPLKDKLFGMLFPKTSSDATAVIQVLDTNGQPLPTDNNGVPVTDETSIKLILTAPSKP